MFVWVLSENSRLEDSLYLYVFTPAMECMHRNLQGSSAIYEGWLTWGGRCEIMEVLKFASFCLSPSSNYSALYMLCFLNKENNKNMYFYTETT